MCSSLTCLIMKRINRLISSGKSLLASIALDEFQNFPNSGSTAQPNCCREEKKRLMTQTSGLRAANELCEEAHEPHSHSATTTLRHNHLSSFLFRKVLFSRFLPVQLK